jgi:hypothetical protein
MPKQADNDFRRYDRATLIRSNERLDDTLRAMIAELLEILEHDNLSQLIQWSRKVSAAMKRSNRRQSAALHVLLILATQSDEGDTRKRISDDVRALGRALGVM